MHLNLTMYFAGLRVSNSIFDTCFERSQELSHIASKTGKISSPSQIKEHLPGCQ